MTCLGFYLPSGPRSSANLQAHDRVVLFHSLCITWQVEADCGYAPITAGSKKVSHDAGRSWWMISTRLVEIASRSVYIMPRTASRAQAVPQATG